MSVKTFNLSPDVYEYLQEFSLREPEVLQELRHETFQLPHFRMQISPEQGQLMALLIKLISAKKTLDIGTYTGYSACVVALALPTDGRVITCDINEASTNIAKKFWKFAGVIDKIQLELRPAGETLQMLLDNGHANSFDFSFIDADKAGYADYYEKSLALLRPGGLIAVDNVLWDGRVADPADNDNQTKAIRALNATIAKDNRVDISMIPIGDGLTLARKR